MQKALTQMNLQIHNVINDITGITGLAILDAILQGERNLNKLAALKHARIKASKNTIKKSFEGDYRSEHLFTLKQLSLIALMKPPMIALMEPPKSGHFKASETVN
jgi:hypothetical protein